MRQDNIILLAFVSLLTWLCQGTGASLCETYEKPDEASGTSQSEFVRRVISEKLGKSPYLCLHDADLNMSSEEMMDFYGMPEKLGADDGRNNVWSITEPGDSVSVSFVPGGGDPYPVRSVGATLDLLSRGSRKYSLKGIREFVDRPRFGLKKKSPEEIRVKVTQESDMIFQAVFPPNDTDSVRGWIISIKGRRTEPEEEAVQDLYFVQFPNDTLCTAESLLKMSRAMREYSSIHFRKQHRYPPTL